MKITDFFAIRLKLASPDEIRSWSHGEVTKPETINYRTQKPEKDGLFDEVIFGPTKDYECYCGKYRRIRYKGVVCDRCGVEVTRSIVRRERMGHIQLASPVAHIWFLRSVPSKMGLLLDVSVADLERVIYFAGYIIMSVDEDARKEALTELEREYRTRSKRLTDSAAAAEAGEEEASVAARVSVGAARAGQSAAEGAGGQSATSADAQALPGGTGAGEKTPEKEARPRARGRGRKDQTPREIELRAAYQHAREEILSMRKYQVLSEIEYRQLSLKYGHVFQAGTGPESVRTLMGEIDLEALRHQLEVELADASESVKKKVSRRLQLVKGMIHVGVRPEWMFVTTLPVLPPDLRPMVQLDGGRYATSDLNDLYRRVINRNNRLKKLLDLHAPEVIVRNEKRMLQEAVDALIDNSIRHGQSPQQQAIGGRARPLRSLADMLKGKQGRFRQNLLGKRVDYSGRSVIVVGPELKLWQCGLPKRMALELFRPFVIEKLIDRGIAHNIRGAGRIIEEEGDEVWGILEEVIQGKYVLLNRAPTLHRLSIQAFQPVLIEGLAIQIHPLVTSAFNADFDGDQMAVHLPITAKAQEEARRLMLASLGLLKPATGDPIAYPTRDMVLGCYWLTRVEPDAKGTGKRFASKDEAVLAYENGYIGLQAQVVVPGDDGKLETTVGRHIFNSALPSDFGYVNEEFSSKALKALVAKLVDRYGQQRTSEVVDKIKYIGFEYATRSGISWGMDDLVVPEEKPALIAEADKEIEAVRMNYENGLLTDDERRTLTIEAWERVRGKIEKLVPTRLDAFGTVATMIRSGARGSWNQPVQMMGMRGLMANPTGDIIELPVRSSLKEGMNVLEYFISTHGARKGTADTALRTSAAGYLTRRLIDVSQDVVVRDADCGDTTGITFWREDATELGKTFAERLRGRVIIEGKGKFRVLGLKEAREVDEAGADRIQLRSVTACKTRYGVCQMCYGWDLARNELVAIGTPVGIVAAQAIGEPGTQLTMRTFHTGGVAGGADITQGLPRVEEVFEARSPKWKGVIAEVDGICEDVKEEGRNTLITVATDEGTVDYTISAATAPLVKKGDKIVKGAALCEGHIDLKELYRISGSDAVRRYVIHEVQKIYSLQGADINDRHIEVIARQIFARVRVKNPGDTTMAEGEVVERNRFEEENEQVSRMGGKEAEGQELLMGITKVALSTESFLSAASFQDTARVLIQSAIEGRIDRLQGLKENVIIGRLIPAGTGFHAEQK